MLDLQKAKNMINLQVKKQIDSSKKIFLQTMQAGTISKKIIQNLGANDESAVTKVVYFNTRPIKTYYNSIFNTQTQNTSSVKTSQLAVTDPDIVTISGDGYDPNIGQNYSVYNQPGIDLISEELDYQNQYVSITQNYIDLDSYTSQLNNLETTIYSSSVSDDGKISLTYQIELLKAYSNDIVNNLDYYESLCTNSQYPDSTQNPASIATNNISQKVARLSNCSVNVKGALMSGVIGGFAGGIKAGIVGGTAGTVAIPLIGTVTGAVSGFMGGFAVGFATGVAYGVLSDLLTTCFH